MTDVERLLGWFESGALLRPSVTGLNTVDLAQAIAALGGVRDLEIGAGATQIAERIGAADHYVFVLVDGLGMNLIEQMPEGAFLRRHLALEMRAVFPSTTAAALTSLATGLWPAQHAVPSWWVYLPEAGVTATILPFVERFSGRPLDTLGVERVFPAPPLAPRYRSAARSFQPGRIVDSTYTRYVSGGTGVSGYDSFSEAVDMVLERVSGAAGPTYSYCYVPAVDALAHQHGPKAEAVRRELTRLDQELARLAEELGDHGRLVVSADHGLLTVADEAKRTISPDDELLELLVAPPSGEPRVPFFHVRPGCGERFQASFRHRFGDAFALLTVAEAEELALFGPGPLSPQAKARIGDFVALSSEPAVLFYGPPIHHDGVLAMRGFHGGLTRAEMRIPLALA